MGQTGKRPLRQTRSGLAFALTVLVAQASLPFPDAATAGMAGAPLPGDARTMPEWSAPPPASDVWWRTFREAEPLVRRGNGRTVNDSPGFHHDFLSAAPRSADRPAPPSPVPADVSAPLPRDAAAVGPGHRSRAPPHAPAFPS